MYPCQAGEYREPIQREAERVAGGEETLRYSCSLKRCEESLETLVKFSQTRHQALHGAESGAASS